MLQFDNVCFQERVQAVVGAEEVFGEPAAQVRFGDQGQVAMLLEQGGG